MFQKLKDKLNISVLNSLLDKYETTELETGKRLISVIAGVYILQRGIRHIIEKQPLLAVEEVALGGILLYSAAAGIHKRITIKPVDISDMRRNQIQGNDPDCYVPAFV
ncbi:hypothetical protein [Pedobacter nyackensis]|uniref:Uncharacterized protein n=1 Tax=Pedobacter nyackensis TaxID=475255 RepID=A0A1W2DAK5_9SPHI|nr:hypothetical protein [Pedobacter nyackensis]SMC94162.1 hypothetical protein SAMN04488101_10656 [Pedobacter nyackensis]